MRQYRTECMHHYMRNKGLAKQNNELFNNSKKLGWALGEMNFNDLKLPWWII